jgi:hypothetical protein
MEASFISLGAKDKARGCPICQNCINPELFKRIEELGENLKQIRYHTQA